ncbi:MAG: hypothetical protein KDC88_17175, partial [Ignavibacteriae bacterium]|nr:hypothetical protein [Ignavibacteriota bacterium]
DGLKNNQVHSIGQDNNGFIWFGTPSGLQRFDGYELKTYNSRAHFGRSSLFEDNNGSLWMIFDGGRVYRLDLSTEIIKDYPSIGKKTWDLIQTNEGKIWAATLDDGLAEYIQDEDTFITHKSDAIDSNSISSNSVLEIYPGNDNKLWLGTGKGLNLYDVSNGKFHRLNNGPSTTVHSIAEDKDGIIWLGTRQGLYEFQPKINNFKHYKLESHDRIDNIYVDSNNRIWLVTNLGILSFDRIHSKYLHYQNYSKYKGSDHAWTNHPILESKDGSIWSVSNLRLAKYDEKIKDFNFYHNDPLNEYSVNDEIFSHLFEDKIGNLWFSTKSGGVNYITKFRQYINHFPIKLVTSLYMDKSGFLWIGTQNGIYKTISRNGEITYKKINSIDDIICQIKEDKKGNLWIAGYNHLIKLNKQTETIEKYTTEHRIQRVLVDNEGFIWIGAWNHVYRFNPKKKIFSHIIEFPGTIFTVHQDRYSNIWMSINHDAKIAIFKNNSLVPSYINNIPLVESIFENSNNEIW